MSVTFAEKLVEIKEYKEDESAIQDKKDAYRRMLKQKRKAHKIRNILYKCLPTEEEYIESRQKLEMRINFLKGLTGNMFDESIKLYKDIETGKRIDYSIYKNEYGKINVNIKLKGFMGQKYYKKYITLGNSFHDIFKAEYQSKMFVIETVRKVFEKNNIM